MTTPPPRAAQSAPDEPARHPGEPASAERVPWDASTALDEAMARLRSVLAESKSALAEAADPTPAGEPEPPRTPSAGPARPAPSVDSPTPRTVPGTASATSPGLHTGSHARIEPTTPRPRAASPRRPSASHSARPAASTTLPAIEPDPLPTPSAAADIDSVSFDEPVAHAGAVAPRPLAEPPPRREPKPEREPRPRRTSKRSAAVPAPKPQRKPAADTRARIRLADRLGSLGELWRIRRARIVALALGGALILAAVAAPVVTQFATRSGAGDATEAGAAEGLSGEDLLAEVGTLMVLPEETPTIATVEDPATLSTEPFFARAETGDRVLIFPESRLAVLYRESQHIIVNAGALSIALDPAASDQAPLEEAVEPTAEEVPQAE